MSASFLLSICIPTYNRWKRLDLLVRSLITQIERDGLESKVEVVISDNVSTDRTRELGERWAAKYPFVRYFRNEWNIGGEPNFVRATERGTGKFSWILGDDDQIRDDAIKIIFSYLKPGVTQLFLNFRCVTLSGGCFSPSRLPTDLPDDVTTLELIKRVGFVTVFALISSHVFDREKVLATDPNSLLKISPFYILVTALVIAFARERCVLVREPLIDYMTGNDRYPSESVMYVRIITLLRTLDYLEKAGLIDIDFLYSCYETGGNAISVHSHLYLREELIYNLRDIASSYWATPGQMDWAMIRTFLNRGPGFWGIRHDPRHYFVDDYQAYRNHPKPMIHYWHGKAFFPGFSVLLSSDDLRECEDFDVLMGQWPENFAHESILITRLHENQLSFANLDVLMAPFKRHRFPGDALSAGYRKAQAPRVLILDEVSSPAVPAIIDRIDEWHVKGDAPASCLLFASIAKETGKPEGLLGLYVQRQELIDIGAFENYFEKWNRRRLLADAAFRLRSEGWAVQGGTISSQTLNAWFAEELPRWLRVIRSCYRRPFCENSLNATLRYHLKRVNKELLSQAQAAEGPDEPVLKGA